MKDDVLLNPRNSKSFLKVIEAIKKNSPKTLTDDEAADAAQNAIDFCKTLLSIHKRIENERSVISE